MPVPIHTLVLGVTRCHLLVGDDRRVVLIDAGTPGKEAVVLRALTARGLRADAVSLVLLTHGHWDHYGSARAVRDATSAKVAAHASERERVEQGACVLPPPRTAWGRVFGLVVRGMTAFVNLPPCPIDLVVDDAGLDLGPFGVPGRVLHTPGHSPGSLTVLLPSGDAFVGDLGMNGPPLRRGPGLPAFAEQPERLATSWRLLLDAGARTIHPAHGPAFPAEVMRPFVSR